jgi:hypothetical protein
MWPDPRKQSRLRDVGEPIPGLLGRPRRHASGNCEVASHEVVGQLRVPSRYREMQADVVPDLCRKDVTGGSLLPMVPCEGRVVDHVPGLTRTKRGGCPPTPPCQLSRRQRQRKIFTDLSTELICKGQALLCTLQARSSAACGESPAISGSGTDPNFKFTTR